MNGQLAMLTDAFHDQQKLVLAEEDEGVRGHVIAARSYFETQLGRFLATFFLDSSGTSALLDGDRPLATFSARISICFSLGLISARERDGLNLVRKIANHFAHSFHATFEEEKTRSWVSSFDVVNWSVFEEGDQPATRNLKQQYLEWDTYRKFRFQVTMLSYPLTYRLDTIMDHRIGGPSGKEDLVWTKSDK